MPRGTESLSPVVPGDFANSIRCYRNPRMGTMTGLGRGSTASPLSGKALHSFAHSPPAPLQLFLEYFHLLARRQVKLARGFGHFLLPQQIFDGADIAPGEPSRRLVDRRTDRLAGWDFLTVTDFGGRIMRTLENEAQRVFAAVLHGTRNGERLYCTVIDLPRIGAFKLFGDNGFRFR